MRVFRSLGSKRARSCAFAALAGAASLLSGCAHSLLYDENRDNQAKAAQKAATEAHVADAVTSLEKAFADVAAKEEAFIRDRETTFFDREIIRVSRAQSLGAKFTDSDSSIDGLFTVLDDRLKELGLRANPDGLTTLRTNDANMKGARKALITLTTQFLGAYGHRFRNCPEVYASAAGTGTQRTVPSKRLLQSIAAVNRPSIPGAYKDLVDACDRISTIAKGQVALFDKGAVQDASDQLKTIEGEIAKYEADHEAAKQKIEELSATLPTTPKEKSSLEGVEGAAKKIDGAFSTVTEAFNAAGVQALAEERLQHLQAVVAAIAGSTSEDGKVKLTDSQKRSVAIVRDLPMLNDEANKLFKDAQKPRLVPFLAAIDHEKLVLKGIDAVQDVKRKRYAAVQARQDALLSEAISIGRVLQPLRAKPAWASQSIDALEKQLSGQQNKTELKTLYRALATYGDEVRQDRIDAEVWKSRALAAMYEESLVESKFAAAQWDQLMDTIAQVLADYHASGIKQADVAEFFKALGLVTIGVGVAQ